MASKKSEFLGQFSEASNPTLICPECEHGHLQSVSSELKINEDISSRAAHKEDYWEPEFAYGGFSGKLLCDRATCKNIIFFSGQVSCDVVRGRDDYSPDGWSEQLLWILHPKYFSQTLNLIPIQENYPNSTVELMLSSFELFWLDADSCGNKIRTIVEHLLTLQKIPQFTRGKGKLNRINPHRRIELFTKKNGELGRLMEAIKWIGNYGSHKKGLTKEDLLSAYEMLDIVLTELFNSRRKSVGKIASAIIKKKVPKSVTEKRIADRKSARRRKALSLESF